MCFILCPNAIVLNRREQFFHLCCVCLQLGFGWTNGVALQLLDQYGATLTSGCRHVSPGLLLPLVLSVPVMLHWVQWQQSTPEVVFYSSFLCTTSVTTACSLTLHKNTQEGSPHLCVPMVLPVDQWQAKGPGFESYNHQQIFISLCSLPPLFVILVKCSSGFNGLLYNIRLKCKKGYNTKKIKIMWFSWNRCEIYSAYSFWFVWNAEIWDALKTRSDWHLSEHAKMETDTTSFATERSFEVEDFSSFTWSGGGWARALSIRAVGSNHGLTISQCWC